MLTYPKVNIFFENIFKKCCLFPQKKCIFANYNKNSISIQFKKS